MLQKLLFLVLSCAVVFAEEDPYLMSDFGGEPSGIVEGCVNVITGDYVVRRDDLVVKGHEPIRMPINYSPREIRKKYKVYGGWNFAEKFLTIELDYTDTVTVYEKSGIRVDYFYNYYCVKKGLPLPLKKIPGGWTNTALGDISARNNPLNNKVCSNKKDPREITVEAPDGSVRYYRTKESKRKVQADWTARGVPIEFLLQSEVLPNGNILEYEWEQLVDKRWRVVKIQSKSPGGRVFGWVKISYDPEDDKHRKGLKFTTSDGRTAEYVFDSKYYLGDERIAILQHAKYSFKPNIQYNHSKLLVCLSFAQNKEVSGRQ